MRKFLKKLKPVELAFKKSLMAFLGLFLARTGDNTRIDKFAKLDNILLVRQEKIGDIIATLPLVDAIKRANPECKITFIASPLNYQVIKGDPRFEQVLVYHKGILKTIKLVIKLRRTKFDYAVDLITQDTVTAMLLANFGGPGAIKVGMGKAEFKKFYDVMLPHPHECNSLHIIDYNLSLLKVFNIESSNAEHYSEPHIDEDAESQAKGILRNLKPEHELLVGLNLSAGKPGCEWTQKKFRELAERLLKTYESLRILVITAPGRYQHGVELKRHFDDRVFLPLPDLDLMTVSVLIKNLHILVTPDTSLVHIARAFKVPVVAMYREYYGEYRYWRPYGQKAGMVLSDDRENIDNITVGQVAKEISLVMDEFEIPSGRVGSIIKDHECE